MALIEHAKRELARLRDPKGEPDEMQDAIEAHVMKIVEIFAEEGHSGSSASYTLAIIKKVLAFEPVTPLTGDDDEWNDIAEINGGPLWQNNRCSRVFKEADGSVYDIEGKVFREPSGACFTSRDSRVPVTFPYTPATEIVDVPAEAA